MIWKNKRGAILIYLLILISVLFFLVFHGIFYSKLNYKLAINYVNKTENFEKLKYVTYIISLIIKNHSLYDDFFEYGFLNYYSTERLFKINNEKFYIKIEKEDKKININSASDTKIKEAILKKFENDYPYNYLDSITDKILDWKDKDDYVRLHGAEKDDYKNYGYYPRNGNFQSLFELLYVKDMKEKLFFDYNDKKYSGILTLFTIYNKNVYRAYIKFEKRIYIVFFAFDRKGIRILEWRKIYSWKIIIYLSI